MSSQPYLPLPMSRSMARVWPKSSPGGFCLIGCPSPLRLGRPSPTRRGNRRIQSLQVSCKLRRQATGSSQRWFIRYLSKGITADRFAGERCLSMLAETSRMSRARPNPCGQMVTGDQSGKRMTGCPACHVSTLV